MDVKKMNEDREKMLQEMIDNGQLSVMTECAYGATIANSEESNKINIKNQKNPTEVKNTK